MPHPNIVPITDHEGFSKLPRANGMITRLGCARATAAGVDLEPLLEKAGLTIQQIENRTARIKASDQLVFLELVAQALKDDFLGFNVARDFELREMGLLYYVLASSALLGDALQRAARYCAIANEGILLTYREGKEVVVEIEYVGISRHTDRHQIEALATLMVRMCRQLTGHKLQPSRTRFIHHRDKAPAKMRALLGQDIQFDSRRDEIVFPATIKDMRIVSSDSYLNGMLVSYCEEALSHRKAKRGLIRAEVENAIVPLLPHGKAHVAEICQNLGMSERTLARRLESEGLTFAKVLDNLRHDLASRYLRDENLAISTVAWLLGYQEVSAFTHASKRWTGKSPRQLRSEFTVQ